MIPADILEPLCPKSSGGTNYINNGPQMEGAIVVETGSPWSALSEVHPSHIYVINAISGVEVILSPM